MIIQKTLLLIANYLLKKIRFICLRDQRCYNSFSDIDIAHSEILLECTFIFCNNNNFSRIPSEICKVILTASVSWCEIII